MKKIPKIIERFETACRAYEIRGSMPPEDVTIVEEEYFEAKEALIESYTFLLDSARVEFNRRIRGD